MYMRNFERYREFPRRFNNIRFECVFHQQRTFRERSKISSTLHLKSKSYLFYKILNYNEYNIIIDEQDDVFA